MDQEQLERYTAALDLVIRQLSGPISAEQSAWFQNKLRELRTAMLRDSEEEIDFRAVVDASNDGIYIVDSDSMVRYINPAYTQYTKLLPEEIVGKTPQELVDEGIFLRVASPEVLQSKRSRVLLGYIRTVDGKDLYGYCIVQPILDKQGKVRYAVVTLYNPDRLKGRYSEFDGKNTSAAEPAIRVRSSQAEAKMEPVIGSSKGLRDVYAIAKCVAETDATILICGESGVGKEGVADYICAHSPRCNKPFVKVNCTAIPANLLESELFGYEKGSFTGANNKGKVGLFEQANGGTILLDEIGDLPVDLQAKLLRVTQQKELLRIGSNTPIKLDIRIIASTNADLKKKIAEGLFREDLYYRLSTIPIYLPPLRERREDVSELVRYYLDYFGEHHRRRIQLSDECMAILERYEWPGNIRQLRNVIEYLVVCSGEDYLNNAKPLLRILGVDEYSEENNILPTLEESMHSFEKSILIQTIRKTGSLRKASKLLGIDPATMSRKVKKHNIELPSKREKEQ